ncbi:hypothetical protein JHK82_039558 [Glycine max]|uniref:Uncharacterized protein n=2 Tax=Glycine subgen. Soja TaxID=1462606 RepID=A0A0R0GC88_SOYBN|nr:hypothetical protein JHK87_039537 [Glycine soja]KAG4962877.1 hypothetical protein JHK86_039745 [Glycine max]KAG4965346.1 hypothetical protein JHK85_040321 [Glycine max]KAG5110335.1 hypothetical protein JHK82_039558 [Glycine max]KAG5121620.1 hypothetical protein JHK84_039960 [Glycine max]
MLPEIQMLLIPKQNQKQPNLSLFSLLLELELDHKNCFENHCFLVSIYGWGIASTHIVKYFILIIHYYGL